MKVVIVTSTVEYLEHVAEEMERGCTSGHYDRHNHWSIEDL